MTETSGSNAEIAVYLAALGSTDYGAVQSARRALIAMGAQAIEPLWAARAQADDRTRWEITKTLAEIHDPRAADRLVQILIEDPDPGIRWLAAEGLIGLGAAGLPPLLEALIHRSDSAWLRQEAHHVLKALAAGPLEPLLRPVLQALEGLEPALQAPIAAQQALQAIAGHSFPQGDSPWRP